MKRLATSVFVLTCLTGASALAKEPPVSFQDDVMPILQIRCLMCHQPGGEGFEKSGFDLRTYDSLMKGTRFGPMVIPGDADTSNLMVLIDGKAKGIQMPHGKRKLSICDRDLIRTWIRDGAKNN